MQPDNTGVSPSRTIARHSNVLSFVRADGDVKMLMGTKMKPSIVAWEARTSLPLKRDTIVTTS